MLTRGNRYDPEQTQPETWGTEDFLKSVYEGIQVGIFVLDVLDNERFRVAGINPALETITGVSNQQVAGKEIGAAGGRWGEFLPYYLECARTGKTITYEFPRTHGSETTWLMTVVQPLKDSAGKIYRLVGSTINMTFHKKAEERLRELERAVTASSNGITINRLDEPDFPFVYVNPAFERITGYTAEEVFGKSGGFLEGDETDQPGVKELWSALSERRECHVVVRNYRKDGTPFWNELRLAPVKDASGRVTSFIGVVNDITQRVQAEEALRQRLKEALLLNRVITTAGLSLEPNAILHIFCGELARALGLPQAAFAMLDESKSFLTVAAEYCEPGRIPALGMVLPLEGNTATQYVLEQQKPLVVKNAQTDPQHPSLHEIFRQRGTVSLLIVPVIIRDKVIGTLGLDALEMRDFTEEEIALAQSVARAAGAALENARLYEAVQQELDDRKRAEEALAAEKERLAVTLSSIGDGVIATDTEGRVVLFNKAAQELTGFSGAEATSGSFNGILRLYSAETRQPVSNPVQQVLETGESIWYPSPVLLISRDGRERLITAGAAPLLDTGSKIMGAVLAFSDVTEKQRLAEEVLKSSKLESLGLLAGGIAHDFNNILTAIVGSLTLARMNMNNPQELKIDLDNAEKASFQARNLTQQLLTFAKGGAPVKKTALLPEIIIESAQFALRGSRVECLFDLPDNLWPLEVDPGQLSQVIQNLIINADQAMPGGGKISVRAINLYMEADNSFLLNAGRYIKISVRDEGYGISPENLQRIFDPYFTTKEKGSGLGLATCYSIIKKHEGHITVESEPGKGSTFIIYLPASTKTPVTVAETRDAALPVNGRLLLMDDDEAVLQSVSTVLRRLGYEVTVTRDGAEAVRRYGEALQEGSPYQVVLTDLTIRGGMGGKETVGRLLEIDPHAKVIVSSGYSDDPVMANYQEYGFAGRVSKPFSLSELKQALAEINRL